MGQEHVLCLDLINLTIRYLVITQIMICCHVMAPKLFLHGILQRKYLKMTIKWSFSYNLFVKLPLFNLVYLEHCGSAWLSGRVLDLRSRGCGFEPHQRHCVMSFSMTHLSSHCLVLVQPRKTGPNITEKLLAGT